MKMCQSHYEQLKDAIKDRGLWAMVSKSGIAAAQRMKKELDGTGDPKVDHDPLLNAYFAIITNAMRVGGSYLLGQDIEGQEYCPLCELGTHLGNNHVIEWINCAADDEKKLADKVYDVRPS
jgi:hypothetical protein